VEQRAERTRKHLHRGYHNHHGHGSYADTVRAIQEKVDAAAAAAQAKADAEAQLGNPFAPAGAAAGMAVQGPPPATIYVELLLTSDNLRYKAYGDQTEHDSASLANMMAEIYASTVFNTNVVIVLVAQVAFIVNDPWTVARGACSECASDEVSVDELLAKWNSWRSNSAVAPAHDDGHLLSGHNFQSTVLGYAGVGVQCNNAHAGGINEARKLRTTEYTATVVTHEMGHNFGMSHDSQGNTCPSSGYVMNAIVGAIPPKVFSTCSVAYFNSYVDDSLLCLQNKPTKQWGEDPVCGNGFVEEGELCDCGSHDCTGIDDCCDGATCQLAAGAQCSNIDPCCNQCNIVGASASHVCRAATSSCDIAEMCDGVSSSCPTDLYVGSGHTCTSLVGGTSVTGACYAGSCVSHAQSCRSAGATFAGAPYSACSSQSRLNDGNFCATMFCSSASSSSGSCTYFSTSGTPRIMDSGISCGDGMQCFNGACVSSNSLSTAYAWEPSPYSSCDSCGSEQTRTAACVATADSTSVEEGQERLCPPNSAKPELVRPCQNETLRCVYAEDIGSDVRIFTVRIPALIFAFVCLGFVFVFAAAISLCYRAVSKPSEGGIKNMYDRKLAAERKGAKPV
jgi:hypothetical protein